MHKNLRNGVALVLLAAAALATWYWGRRPSAAPSTAARGGAYPLGYYLRDAELLGTDQQGRVVYRLKAQLAKESPNAEQLELEGVHFEYQPAEDVPWTVSAAKGTASADNDSFEDSYLELSGNVELTRKDGPSAESIRIMTERLRLDPANYVATAKGPVRFVRGGQALDAIGLKANLKQDRFKLESQVHGYFTH